MGACSVQMYEWRAVLRGTSLKELGESGGMVFPSLLPKVVLARTAVQGVRPYTHMRSES